MKRDINTNLVSQHHRADREAELLESFVQLKNVIHLKCKYHRLINVRTQTPIHEEPRNVFANDRQLSLFESQLDSSGNDFFVRGLVRNDFQKLHLGNRREIMHSNNIVWSRGKLGDLRHRQRGRVGCDDTIRLANRLHLLDYLMLQGQILKHGLYHKITLLDMILPRRHVIVHSDQSGHSHVFFETGHSLLFDLVLHALLNVCFPN
mmetsp:Transcript_26208/g.86195  ORF Transcript_26208/g.86195 Transcript_26208/m.86195 type:complete len:206 (+) Transcript_26208:1245-1862(+)